MRKIFVIITVLLLVGGIVLAADVLPSIRAQNARVMAMGEAFTAVADDGDALFYNPAGLAFQEGSSFVLGGSMLFDTNSNMATLMPDDLDSALPISYDELFDLRPDTENENQVIVDANGNGVFDSGDTVYDLTDYGFKNTLNGIYSIRDWYNGVVLPVFVANSIFDELRVLPNLSYTSGSFGIGLLGGVGIKPDNTITLPDSTDTYDYGFRIFKKQGLIAGKGFRIGQSIGLGVNVKYFNETYTEFGLPNTSFLDFETNTQALTGVEDLQEALNLIFFEDVLAEPTSEENSLKVGLGGMATFGTITIGAYVDSILELVLDSKGEITNDFKSLVEGAADTANIGISYDPSMRKIFHREPFLNLILSADLKNIGDEANRFLNLGGELGIHVGPVVQADVRAGYKQYLLGPLDSLLTGDIIDANNGELTLGLGAQVFFCGVDFAVALPSKLVRDVFLRGPDSFDEAYFNSFGPNFPRFMLTFGLDF